MGRSKFPGKPSKLVNKKRVSVLNGVSSGPFGDNYSNEDDTDDLANDQVSLSSTENDTTTTTTPPPQPSTTTSSGHDGDAQKPNPPDPPDTEMTDKSDPGIVTRAGRKRLPAISEAPAGVGEKAVRKKTVTFKNVLETSDDLNIVKKVYNPNKVPAVPIIKINREELSRLQRFARGEIVRESRLTEVLKNYSANHIDKLNLLTFKSCVVASDTCDNAGDKMPVATGSRTTTDDGSDATGIIDSAITDKKFVLPKRSAHSCRVIKPNKRFLDDSNELSTKYNRKLNAAAKKAARRNGEIDGNLRTDHFINNTLSSQISKLNEDDEDDDDAEDDEDDDETVKPNKAVNIKDATDGLQQLSSDWKLSDKKAAPLPFSSFAFQSLSSTPSKLILRPPKFQFSSLLSSTKTTTTEGPFSLFANSANNSINSTVTPIASPITCSVCGTQPAKTLLPHSRKFGTTTTTACDACRKFIAKFLKNPSKLRCHKHADGNSSVCEISPSHVKSSRTIKERCSSCWLNKCATVFPDLLRNKVGKPETTTTSTTSEMLSPFRIQMEATEIDSSTNIFTTSTFGRSSLAWPATETTTTAEGNDFKSKISLSNQHVEHNSTFGSSGLKPQIASNPVIMTKTMGLSTSMERADVFKNVNPPVINTTTAKTIATAAAKDSEEVSRLRVRKKEPNRTEIAAPIVALSIVPAVVAEPAKRQRIDLKGPRVKHVCRSASIVLGQPIATFPDESNVLSNMDTPPRPDSPMQSDVAQSSITLPTDDHIVADPSHLSATCKECTPNAPPSPPTTPIASSLEDPIVTDTDAKITTEQEETNDECNVKSMNPPNITESELPTTDSLPPVIAAKQESAIVKPITRKLGRPTLLSNKHLGISSKKLNSFSRPSQQRVPSAVALPPPLISIDFWENYDPAEVSQTGFGLIVSEQIPLRALCFLCGSSGKDPLIFCVCCCEPYHQYCVEDEYNIKSAILDDTNASIVDTTGTISALNNRLHWLCPRCTVCYTCNMASGSKVKCQKCQKNYHSTCLGTSKRLLGADRPLICAGCLKCKSCGTTTVSKFVGNLPMCSPCFRLRQKGNFCPLCQKCYEDNDFNIKMMECGDCRRWVHAKCEGLTDEQYNMLSVLPENIEFICRKCARGNATADTWRDAVAAEFKSGLLSVVRLLSKSRQACALLKLSPRKKPGSCVCQPLESSKTINFGEENIEMDDCVKNEPERLEDDSDEVKCYCEAGQKLQYQHQPTLSLLDIKQKVNSNEYYSLADFNYDMIVITSAAACDELMITYKEIVSEQFPWFQNETKACTDALEEDMYDSCNFAQTNSATVDQMDQQVPMIGVPENIEDYFYAEYSMEDTRMCLFCRGLGEGAALHESRLLYCGQNGWAHTNCAMWSAEVFEEIDGSLQNVHSAISRGRLIKCSKCGMKGATVGCNVRNCGKHYHYPCAHSTGCAFMVDKTVYCPQHLCDARGARETDFEIIRPVYVELDRKKKKFINPGKVQFMIGSLKVRQLGRFVNILSDTHEAIVPTDFLCTRLYWSTKEPWKIVEYTVRTYIQNNSLTINMDTGRNFIVDHSRDGGLVMKKLAQINKWHESLANGDDFEYDLTTNCNNSSDETNEDEPQNNANDLLPPEIKDAIFEDLPHDILDGISMLDIFPKLMTYEDLVAMDTRNEVYLNSSDISRDAREYNMSEDDDFDEDTNTKDYEDSWIGDALLSANRPTMGSTSRELKRSKSEIFTCGVGAASRSHQRSSSLTWSCKLDSTSGATKRRKVSRFDLRIPDGVLFQLGRRKDDFIATNISERRLSLQQTDDIKTKTFTWNTTKKSDDSTTDAFTGRDILEKFKISQLDGMDDVSSGSSEGGGSPVHEYAMNITFESNTIEGPVKCDRCHCTYRTYDSYHRHRPTCEPLSSTSESESETTARSPDMQSPNMVITAMNSQDFCNIINSQQHQQHQQQQQQQQSQIFNLNGQQISLQNLHQSQPIHLQNNGTMGGLQNNGIPMQGMILNPSPVQQQIFAPMQQQQHIFPMQTTNLNQFNGTPSSVPQTITLPNGVSIQTSQQPMIMHQQQQPQIISLSQANHNSPQLMTISASTPMHQQNFTNYTTTSRSSTMQQSPYKNQLILPQPTDKLSAQKRQPIQRNQQQTGSTGPRAKGRPPSSSTKPIQMKRTVVKTESKPMQIYQQQQQQQLPMIRPIMSDGSSLMQFSQQSIQQQPNQHQPIIMQQLGGNNGQANNMMQYVTDSNGVQYIALPTGNNEFKHPQQPQYITPNSMVHPNTFQIQTDTGGNLVLSNAGLQVMPNGTLQLTQQQTPQVIGTIIQNQPNALQPFNGMISAEQLGFNANPTLEMVTNPANGCMMLTSQPMYYGLETIVQNTVMSSQQFVSSAMQGVLSQNSSFSATTTQVFQASKIEPIMEMPTGYVVLNNDGTIMQQQSTQQPSQQQQQPSIMSNSVLQQGVSQIQQQPQPTKHQPVQPQVQLQPQQQQNTTSWRLIDEKSNIQLLPQSIQHHTDMHNDHQLKPITVQHKPTIKSAPIVVQKMATQKVYGSNAQHQLSELKQPVILPKPITGSVATIDGQHYMIQTTPSKPTSSQHQQNFKPTPTVVSSITIQPAQRKTNLIRPIAAGTKITNNHVKPITSPKQVTTSKMHTTKSQTNQKIMSAPVVTIPVAPSIKTEPTPRVIPIYDPSTTVSAMEASSNNEHYTVNDIRNTNTNSCFLVSDLSTASNAAATTKNTVNMYNFPSSNTIDNSNPMTQVITCQILSPPPATPPPAAATSNPVTPSSLTKIITASSSQGNYVQQPSLQYSTSSTMQQPIASITLPTSASIQLPTAPYAPAYSNGIPTNVVNPIQQYTNYTHVSRPTNRVLPMQTSQPKNSLTPTSTAEITTAKTPADTLNKNVIIIKQLPSPGAVNSPMIPDKVKEDTHNDDDDDDDDDIADNDDATSSLLDDDKASSSSNNGPSTDDIFNKLKCESNILMHSSNNETSPQHHEEQMDDTPAEQHKSTINEILKDLENAQNQSSSMTDPSLYEEMSMAAANAAEPHEGAGPDSTGDSSSEMNHKESAEDALKIVVSQMVLKEHEPPAPPAVATPEKPSGPKMLYEIQSQDGFTYKSTSVTEVWEKVFEAVQLARKAHGLQPLPDGPLADMCGYQMLGLKTNALKYLVEQLPGVEKCSKYVPRYHKRPQSTASAASSSSSSGYCSASMEELKENPYGAARCEGYSKRSEYDMFSWLASRHRKQPIQMVVPQNTDTELIPRRGTGSNLPMAMRYRTLKESYKESVGVYRSHIHGRGLFCNRDIEAGEMVIEYAGELIRSTLTDKRERYYDGRGIGCYMFKIDENHVVDATMRGNAARFINHACEPNCYSKVVEILGHKHIIIFALRRIVQGEELTYDYKFPLEDTKLPCSCGSRKCRKSLN